MIEKFHAAGGFSANQKGFSKCLGLVGVRLVVGAF